MSRTMKDWPQFQQGVAAKLRSTEEGSSPCEIADMSTYKTGKYEHARAHCKRLKDPCPFTHNMEVPTIKHMDFQLTDLKGKFLSLMGNNGKKTREDPNKCAVCRIKKTNDANMQGYSR